MDDPVLAVDLDGTLLRTDSLWESLLLLLRERPLSLGPLVLALLKGRAEFKAHVAELTLPDVAALPLNEPLLDWLADERRSGRHLVLATAADQRIAAAVAERVGLFDAVLASDAGRNLKGGSKANALVTRFGRGGFDYAGDAYADLPVWRAARRAIVVGGPALERAARRVAEVERVFAPGQGRPAALLRALRPHQWAKNLLILLPLLAAHRLDAPGLLAAVLAFIAFGLTASAVYLINDLLDLGADRRHPRKCRRPFASG
jgi:phosphoserine phosphatase